MKPTIKDESGKLTIELPDITKTKPKVSSTGKTEQLFYAYGKTGTEFNGRALKYQLRVYVDTPKEEKEEKQAKPKAEKAEKKEKAPKTEKKEKTTKKVDVVDPIGFDPIDTTE